MNARPMHAQRGSVSLMVAFLLPIFLGLAAFAIDIVYLQVARNELQNDADAAALAGAGYFFDGTNATPRWTLAEQKAHDAIGFNAATGKTLQSGTVASGYWNLVDTPKVLQALPMVPKAYDAPAVKVTVVKDANHNDGEVDTLFARYWWGILSHPVQASAVAGLSSPNTITSGYVFPFVLSECLYDTYWNFTSTPAGPKLDAQGKPVQITLKSINASDICLTGAWTSFEQSPPNGDKIIKDMISSPTPVNLDIGQSIWVEPGTSAKLFGLTADCIADKTCEYVTIPLVKILTPQSLQKISAFACLHMVSADQGEKEISVELSTKCKAPTGSGVGPNYGVVSPPRLFQ